MIKKKLRAALNGHVSPNKADIINDDKNYEKEYEHQITGNFKESDNDIEPAKFIMAEIVMEKKDNNTDGNQIQWNTVEVWKQMQIQIMHFRVVWSNKESMH